MLYGIGVLVVFDSNVVRAQTVVLGNQVYNRIVMWIPFIYHKDSLFDERTKNSPANPDSPFNEISNFVSTEIRVARLELIKVIYKLDK